MSTTCAAHLCDGGGLTAVSVAFVGMIGSVDLVAPHAARALVGDEQRSLLPL